MRKEDTRMQETSKEKRNLRDLGPKCREDAEKRETTGQKNNVKKQNRYSRQKKQTQLTGKSEKIFEERRMNTNKVSDARAEIALFCFI